PRAQLPAHDVAPLVVEERQVAVALDPLAVQLAEQRLRRRPDGVRLLELLAARVRDDGELGGEALDVLGLALEVAHGDQQREVEVLVTGRLEHRVEVTLDVLPQRVAVRPEDEAATHRAEVHELGAVDDVVVPAWEVVCLERQGGRLRHVGDSTSREGTVTTQTSARVAGSSEGSGRLEALGWLVPAHDALGWRDRPGRAGRSTPPGARGPHATSTGAATRPTTRSVTLPVSSSSRRL